MSRARLGYFGALLMFYGCTGEPERAPEPVSLRDSAGVQLIDNHAPEWDTGSGWKIRGPLLSIGVANGDSAGTLWDVTAAVLLRGDSVAILSGKGRTASIYTPDGRLARSFGRAGNGPGEFKYPVHMQYFGPDTIRIWDHFYGGVTTFLTSGVLVGTKKIDLARLMAAAGAGRSTENFTPLRDQSLVIHASQRNAPPPPPNELFRPQHNYVHVNTAYEATDLGQFGGIEAMYPEDLRTLPPLIPAFPVRAVVATGGNPEHIYTSNGDRSIIYVHSPKGKLIRQIRKDGPGKVLPDDVRDRALKRMIDDNARTPEARATWERRNRQLLPDQEYYPAVQAMVVDDIGNLWTHDGGGDWSVFNTEGHWLGVAKIPFLKIFDIRNNRILGLTRDSDDVEIIQVYSILRGARKN